jgi:hypothetical protein
LANPWNLSSQHFTKKLSLQKVLQSSPSLAAHCPSPRTKEIMSAPGSPVSPVINTYTYHGNGVTAVTSQVAKNKGVVASAVSAAPNAEVFGLARIARPPAPAFPSAEVQPSFGNALSNPSRPPFLAALAPQFPVMGNASTTPLSVYKEKPVYSAPAYRDYSSRSLTAEQIRKWCEEGKEHGGYKNVWLKVTELTAAIQLSGVRGGVDAKQETAMLAGVFSVAMDMANNNLKTSPDIAQGFLSRLDAIAGQLRTKNAALRQEEKTFTAVQPESEKSPNLPEIPIIAEVHSATTPSKMFNEKLKLMEALYLDHYNQGSNKKLWGKMYATTALLQFEVNDGLISEQEGNDLLDSVIWAKDVLLGEAPALFSDKKQTRKALNDFLKLFEELFLVKYDAKHDRNSVPGTVRP